jgi:hypothetical protein
MPKCQACGVGGFRPEELEVVDDCLRCPRCRGENVIPMGKDLPKPRTPKFDVNIDESGFTIEVEHSFIQVVIRASWDGLRAAAKKAMLKGVLG